ncbi:MAG: outer membrane protein assembly factor [Bacteroidales bacterium]|nr:outer membrane protein assembly factor [Bacteroidales bacterium]
MKTDKRFLLVITILISSTLFGQGQKSATETKSRKGWNFGPLPAISYNSDVGFQYGALCDIYYYGDGSAYPEYVHKFNVEVSQYTKGSGVYHLFYDSKHLLGNIRTTMDISYLTDKMKDFYGFNGYMSYHNDDYGASFYKMDRKLMRFIVDFQGKLTKNIGWAAGVAVYGYKTGEVTLDKYAGEENLYNIYRIAGLIEEDEAEGGTQVEIKAGIVHDTRDHEADPARGFWSEAVMFGSVDYLRFALIHRGYLPVYNDKVTFAYRLGWQGKMAGKIPFYMLQNISTLYMRQITNEGLGGLNSIRGVLRNSVVGDGVVWGNFEIRYRFLDFRFLGQEWYLATNPFFDAGRVVQYHKKSLMDNFSPWSSHLDLLPGDQINNYYINSGSEENFHFSAGIGVKAVMNRNFIISAEWGKPFDKRDGKNGINIGLNYIF